MNREAARQVNAGMRRLDDGLELERSPIRIRFSLSDVQIDNLRRRPLLVVVHGMRAIYQPVDAFLKRFESLVPDDWPPPQLEAVESIARTMRVEKVGDR